MERVAPPNLPWFSRFLSLEGKTFVSQSKICAQGFISVGNLEKTFGAHFLMDLIGAGKPVGVGIQRSPTVCFLYFRKLNQIEKIAVELVGANKEHSVCVDYLGFRQQITSMMKLRSRKSGLKRRLASQQPPDDPPTDSNPE